MAGPTARPTCGSVVAHISDYCSALLRISSVHAAAITMTRLSMSLPLLCAGSFALALLVVRFALSWTLLESVLLAVIAAYIPSYFDGSEYEPLNWRYSPSFARLAVWKSLVSYFDGRIIYEATKAEYEAAGSNSGSDSQSGPGRSRSQFVLAVHPHGVVSWNHALFFTDACGFLSTGPLSVVMQRRDLAAAVLFRIPLFRDLLLALGCVDASAATCHRLLKAGLSMQLYVGGEREQMLSGTQSQPLVVAKERRGFIRLALQYGLPVIPCYVFNEERLYHTSTLMLPLRLALVKAARIALPLAYGRFWWLPLVPLQKSLVMVVGKPLRLGGGGGGEGKEGGAGKEGEKTTTDERVQAALTQYCDELTALFDRHKGKVSGYENARLKVM